jgi:hypothetical protein
MDQNPSSQPRLDDAGRAALCDVADLMDDITFFKRHPARKHRVRYATRAEIERLETVGNKPLTLPPGCRLYVIVRCITPGYFARQFVPALERAGTDVEEDLADVLFDLLAEEGRP